MSDTTYPVKLVYSLQDSASRGLDNIAGHAKSAADHTDLLGSSLSHLAVLAGGAFGLHKATEAFIGFNAELETMQIQAKTMILGTGLAESWDKAGESAAGMMKEFQRFAVTSPVTTKEVMDFSNGISVAVSQAAGGIKDITNFSEQGVIAAKALGAQADYAALELTEGIQKGVTTRQRFLKQLLGFGNIKDEEFNAAKTAGERLQMLQKALNSPAMKHAASDFGGSFIGVKSTLEDIWQLTAGAAGKEVFGAVTAEIKSWNDWLLKNTDEVDKIKESVSKGLMGAFHGVKAAVVFIADHYSEIKMLVEALLLLKGVGMIGGAISGGIGAFSSAISTLGSTATMATTGLAGVVGAAGSVVTGLGLLYIGLEAVAEMIDAEHAREVSQEGDRNAIYDQLTHSQTQTIARDIAITKAKQFGAITDDGKLNQDKFYAGLFGQGYRQQDPEVGTIMKIVKAAWDQDEAFRRTHFGVRAAAEHPKKAEEVKKHPTTVNIHVARVEVKSDDPDRFAIALVDLGRRSLARPTQALTAPRI